MRKLLVAITVCLLLQPVFIQGQTGKLDANSSTEEFTVVDAYYLGRAVAANVLSYYKLYAKNAEAIQYLNNICQTLVINSGNNSAYNGYHVYILDSNEFNALASPGGHIFVTKKLVESCVSEDMLAAVIAHELAHVMLRHSITIIKETRLENDLSSVAGWASSTAASVSSSAAKAANFRASITQTVDVLMKNGYSQAQEFEADLEAVVILAKAGYDPNALIGLLRILQQFQTTQKTGFYSTHPSPLMRISNLERINFRTLNTSQYRANRFKSLKL